MESGITNECKSAVPETVHSAKTKNAVITDSEDSFQSLIYGLFEESGIINDVRAYLRGHIVEVLKSAQTGDPLQCQKRFTQRLELTYQALNMLIAEYLMRLEFNYSLSVFLSEIPLANMVFKFSKALMEKIGEDFGDMRFKDTDVWSILNCLGVQCDSDHASKIVQMYNNEKQSPLLLCILKCMPMFKEYEGSINCLSPKSVASTKSLNSVDMETPQEQPECTHYNYCKRCRDKMYMLKKKYKEKQKYYAKNVVNKDSNSLSSMKLGNHDTNIDAMEKNIIEKVFKNMFQQLKDVYETELEMIKVVEERNLKRSIATHEMKLQKKQDELEETFKARELELELNVQNKKKFLWGLARSLRDQHLHLTRAMHDVRAETERLEVKEDSLKSQLAEAEKILKNRGEEMRQQITSELAILEGHLEAMKRERENITLERSALENLKNIEANNSQLNKQYNMKCEEIHAHYNLLKNELAILKMYVQSPQMQAKCVVERGTVTEPMEMDLKSNVALNNSQGNGKCSKSDDLDDRLKMNQVINNFRKKNVNFSQTNLDEIFRESNRDNSRSSNSSEAGDTVAPDLDLERGRDRDLIQRLRDENDRLKADARRHSAYAPQSPRAAAPLRPRTAPPTAPRDLTNLNSTAGANTRNVGWRKGAGEELSMFSNAQPRILVPGDTLPFIGVLRDRHGNARRLLTAGAQARPGRSRSGSLAGVSKHAAASLRDRHVLGSTGQGLRVSGAYFPIASCSLQTDEDAYQLPCGRLQQHPQPAHSLQIKQGGSKSPRPMLKETKDKPRSSRHNSPDVPHNKCPNVTRDKSPSTVLREAKQRLRKLEIEAEAVEKSYRDFRRRQSERRLGRKSRSPHSQQDKAHDDSKQKLNDTNINVMEAHFTDLQKSIRGDFDMYLQYKNNLDIGETHLRSKPTVAERAKPIPAAYVAACKDPADTHGNYLETSLTEFRKLYTSNRRTPEDNEESSAKDILSDTSKSKEELDDEPSLQDALRTKRNKQAELQVLKQNIKQMYPSSNDNCDSDVIVDHQIEHQPQTEEENKLKVEVETISESIDIKSQAQDLVVVVQSAVDSEKISEKPSEMYSAQMTIIVSPKRAVSSVAGDGEASEGLPRPVPHSPSPEEVARLTRNDVLDAIFHANPNDVSSVQMQLQLNEEDSITEYDKTDYEYTADNGDSSPISLAKSPQDDDFWKS